jgi:hypothetical protein
VSVDIVPQNALTSVFEWHANNELEHPVEKITIVVTIRLDSVYLPTLTGFEPVLLP